MGDHHVLERADGFIKLRPVFDGEALGHVDLDVVDELSVPDRLEQPVGEPEREDVLRGFLAEEVVDPEDLFLVEPLVNGLVEFARALQVDAERLLHDDPGVLREVGLVQGVHHRQHRLGRDAQVVQQPDVLAAERLGLFGDRACQGLGAALLRHERQIGDELFEQFVGNLVVRELLAGLVRLLTEGVGVEFVQRRSDDAHLGGQLRAG